MAKKNNEKCTGISKGIIVTAALLFIGIVIVIGKVICQQSRYE